MGIFYKTDHGELPVGTFIPPLVYVCKNQDLWDAIEAASKIKEDFDELYLLDPAFQYHLKQVGIVKSQIPSFLKVLSNKEAIVRAVHHTWDMDKVKRGYLIFFDRYSRNFFISDKVIGIINLPTFVSIEMHGFIKDSSLVLPCEDLRAYR